MFDIDNLNEWKYYRSIRLYQYYLLTDIDFTITVNGERFDFPQLGANKSLTCFGARVSNSNYYRIADDLGRGFPLKLVDAVAFQAPAIMERTSAVGGLACVIGHENFAHSIWNAAQGVYDFSIHHPDLFSELNFIERSSSNCITNYINIKNHFSFNELEKLDPSHFLPISSCYVGKNLADMYLHYCLNSISKTAKSIASDIQINKATGRRVFLFSVQCFQKRKFLNQEDFIVESIRRLIQIYPNSIFILDGFSIVNDSKTPKAWVADNALIISKIISRLGSGIPIIDINGLTLSDCLYLYRFVDAAITHEGSQHHKISWFYGVFHVLHSPVPSSANANWHKNQSALATTPWMIPSEWIGLNVDNNVVKRNQNYFVSDLGAAISEMLEVIKSGLGANAMGESTGGQQALVRVPGVTSPNMRH